VPFVTTFGRPTANVTVTGTGTYEQMRPVVQRGGVYLATARETFGIGTLEALAAGVPVAGWRYGGQEEIVINGETGYLVEYGDFNQLAQAIRACLSERSRLSRNCIEDARNRWGWQARIKQYADLYTRIYQAYHQARAKVSVIVTCYNLGKYLTAALESVKFQTMRDWECLVINDQSTERGIDTLVAGFGSLDGRFHYLETPQNLGLSGARNYGWQRAKGKYVLFLDADDILAPNTLDVLSQSLDLDSSIHIAYGSLDTISHDGGNQKRNPWPAGEFNWNAQIAHLNQLSYAAMMRREVLERSGGYRTRDWRAEDASFWSRATSFGFRAAKVTDDATLIYRIRNDSKGSVERREHTDVDGDWTAWLPWRLAGDPDSGLAAMRTHTRPNTRIVPFGAQGQPPAPLKAWPVRHFQHPIVSIIIPVGPGHERYLADALDSVQAQTMPEWECIVVNDTGGVLDLAPWPWIRPADVSRETSAGAGAARNAGLALARAPLVLFLDADDVIVPRALELLLKSYADSGGRYVYSDWLTLEDERRIDGPMEPHEVEEYDARKMLSGLRHAVTALIPAEWARAVGGFDEALPVFEDWDFYCKLAASGYCGVRVPHPLLIYRRASGLRTRAALKPRENADDVAAYTPLGEAAAAAIIDRYTPWTSGEERIMGCCSGSAPIIAQANEALGDMVSLATGGAVALSAPVSATNGLVRMEFVGDQAGAQSFYGKGSGRLYRAGREPLSRFHDVDPRDVEHFVALGLFRVVAADPIANVVEEQPAIAVEPRAEPAAQRRVKGRKVA
jgi:glycosyltransferase involved in cell wall biosynthesis